MNMFKNLAAQSHQFQVAHKLFCGECQISHTMQDLLNAQLAVRPAISQPTGVPLARGLHRAARAPAKATAVVTVDGRIATGGSASFVSCVTQCGWDTDGPVTAPDLSASMLTIVHVVVWAFITGIAVCLYVS